jgi:hypothetical protein
MTGWCSFDVTNSTPESCKSFRVGGVGELLEQHKGFLLDDDDDLLELSTSQLCAVSSPICYHLANLDRDLAEFFFIPVSFVYPVPVILVECMC